MLGKKHACVRVRVLSHVMCVRACSMQRAVVWDALLGCSAGMQGIHCTSQPRGHETDTLDGRKQVPHVLPVRQYVRTVLGHGPAVQLN